MMHQGDATVKRTTVYLPDSLKAELSRTARERGTTEAEVIRAALTDHFASGDGPAPRLPLFRSGAPGLAKEVARDRKAALDGYGR